MSKQDFEDFINKQVSKKQDEPQIDWDKNRDEWLEHIQQFYKMIEGFLEEYKTSGKLSYYFSKKDVFEEYIGSYSVDVMDIKLGEYRVKLEPIGTNLIGAYGRIDLIGAMGKIKFVLVNKAHSRPPAIKFTIKVGDEPDTENLKVESSEKIELEWKISTPPPRIEYSELNDENFLNALIEVVGG